MWKTGPSCSFAFNRSSVDVCNAFSILPSSLRLQLTRARTNDKAALCGSRLFFTCSLYKIKAEDGTRTRDVNLGKVAFYH